jgi:hypothetical protein
VLKRMKCQSAPKRESHPVDWSKEASDSKRDVAVCDLCLGMATVASRLEQEGRQSQVP